MRDADIRVTRSGMPSMLFGVFFSLEIVVLWASSLHNWRLRSYCDDLSICAAFASLCTSLPVCVPSSVKL